jgi:hypothetical protein
VTCADAAERTDRAQHPKKIAQRSTSLEAMSGSSSVSRATVFVEGVGNDVCCPFVDQEDNLFYLLQESGEVIAIDPSGETERIHCTNGQPSGATFDEQGILYISDLAHGAVLAVHEAGNDQQEFVVGVYEDKPLKAPHSIVAGKNNLEVFYAFVVGLVSRSFRTV